MKAFVDANPRMMCMVTEEGKTKLEAFEDHPTNNEAEYRAVFFGVYYRFDMGRRLERGPSDLELGLIAEEQIGTYVSVKVKTEPIDEICSDSELVVKQLNHEYAIRNPKLLEWAKKIWDYSDGKVKFTWVPRESNKAGKVLG